MKFQSRKIQLLTQSDNQVVFQNIPDGNIQTLSKYVFEQFLLAGAFDVINYDLLEHYLDNTISIGEKNTNIQVDLSV